MNPLTIKPLAALGSTVLILALGFAGGWLVNGWRLGTENAEVRADAADARAASAGLALSQLEDRIKTMAESATGFQADTKTLNGKLDLLRKDLKNAQSQKPLPDGCRPDTDRLRNLQRAIDATNATVQGAATR